MLLRTHRDELLRGIGASEDLLETIREARSETPADDEHDPEGATLSTEWSRAEGLHADAQRELLEIDAAIVRLEQGAYGTCGGCHLPIPRDRLRVRPTATLCVACASAPKAYGR